MFGFGLVMVMMVVILFVLIGDCLYVFIDIILGDDDDDGLEIISW